MDDRFDGVIDEDTFRRQQQRLREEGAKLFEKLREVDSEIDDGYLVTAHRVLELAKCAKTLWNGRTAQEKCELLEKLVCNPRLEGRTVRYDLRKPFAALAQMRGEGGWRPQGGSERSGLLIHPPSGGRTAMPERCRPSMAELNEVWPQVVMRIAV